jgi:hypothetical protein
VVAIRLHAFTSDPGWTYSQERPDTYLHLLGPSVQTAYFYILASLQCSPFSDTLLRRHNDEKFIEKPHQISARRDESRLRDAPKQIRRLQTSGIEVFERTPDSAELQRIGCKVPPCGYFVWRP